MKIEKKDLNFINFYAACSNTRLFGNDKIQICSIKDSTDIIFCQIIDTIQFVSILKNINVDKKEFSHTYITGQLNHLLSLSNEDLEILDDKIRFGKKSEYTLEKFDFTPYNQIAQNAIQKINNSQSFKLKNIDNIKNIKFCLGDIDSDLYIVGLFNGWFVASDKLTGTGLIKTENIFNDSYYFHPIFLNIANFFELKELDVYEVSIAKDDTRFCIKVENTFMFIDKIEKSILPNFFEQKYVECYEHPFIVELNRKELMIALKRLQIVASDKHDYRITVEFKKDILRLKNEDGAIAFEDVEATIPNEVIDGHIIISLKNTAQMLSAISEERVEIRVEEKDKLNEIPLIKLSGKGNKELFFMQNLFE